MTLSFLFLVEVAIAILRNGRGEVGLGPSGTSSFRVRCRSVPAGPCLRPACGRSLGTPAHQGVRAHPFAALEFPTATGALR